MDTGEGSLPPLALEEPRTLLKLVEDVGFGKQQLPGSRWNQCRSERAWSLSSLGQPGSVLAPVWRGDM